MPAIRATRNPEPRAQRTGPRGRSSLSPPHHARPTQRFPRHGPFAASGPTGPARRFCLERPGARSATTAYPPIPCISPAYEPRNCSERICLLTGSFRPAADPPTDRDRPTDRSTAGASAAVAPSRPGAILGHHHGMRRYVLTITCPDRIGIVAAVTGFIAGHGGSVLEAAQHGDLSSETVLPPHRGDRREPAVRTRDVPGGLRSGGRGVRHGMASHRHRPAQAGGAPGEQGGPLPGRPAPPLAQRRSRMRHPVRDLQPRGPPLLRRMARHPVPLRAHAGRTVTRRRRRSRRSRAFSRRSRPT